ncbi:2-(R)-hydroxypropyl-CoM dehydrogenase [Botryosphaeria dothidea]|uniref:2-(R)-hydroxypropyl-CoM dehydrogenase n=1 Tax=Botryosphaeria dothidea TaxID=55169 RepID=A0A8H4IJS3_9PEZI|nr:2-(R)-hydroxypropyl-CoM dehydrogenase [Botryosphaeria dothidea]
MPPRTLSIRLSSSRHSLRPRPVHPTAARNFSTTWLRASERERKFPEQDASIRTAASLPPSAAPAYPAPASHGGHVPRLHGKVALVTGAASGLGRAIALAYASHGAKLVVCADLHADPQLGVEEGEDAALPTHKLIEKEFGQGKAVFAKCNVGTPGEVKGAVDLAVSEGGGRLDIIVNNAGLGTKNRFIRVHEKEDDEFDRVMKVNVRGVYLGCKYACAQFLKQGPDATGRKGWIVNVASMLGYVGITGGAAAYCASKGAVLNMTRQIAVDYASDKIHCNALCPGFTKTSMTRGNFTDPEVNASMINTTPWGEWGNVADVAKGAVFLASDDAAWVTGVGLPVDGGYLAQY